MSDLDNVFDGRAPAAPRANPVTPASGEYGDGAAMVTTPPPLKPRPDRLGEAGGAVGGAVGSDAAAGTSGGASVVDGPEGAAPAGPAAQLAMPTPSTAPPAMPSPASSPSGPSPARGTTLRVTDVPLDAGMPMIRGAAPRPRSGWRAVAYDVTSGRWNPGPSPRELREREREQQIARHLQHRHVTAFFCLKGGVSKTSTTAATSIALANLRPDPVFAIDANPDAGDLAERLVGGAHAGITSLARDIDSIRSLEDLSRYTVTTGRLTVLPGDPNPVLGDSLKARDIERVIDVVGTYYSLLQVDCGTGVTHPLMSGVLEHTDTAVIPAAWSITGARRAAETIDWLENNGFARLAATSIVVLTAKDVVSDRVDRDAVLAHLGRAADLVVVPADPHVADGATLQWELLQSGTQEAYLDIAASITSRFRAE